MNLKLTPGRLLAAAIVVLAFWIVHGFIQALLAAGLTAIASWPLYLAFLARLPRNMGHSSGAVIFTIAITVFLLAPMVFALWALLSEAHALLYGLAAADNKGLPLPDWLADTPVFGPWLAARWQQQLAGPGALSTLTQHTDPGALLGWAQSLGQFTFRHALTVGFTVLLLGFLYQEGGSLARKLTGVLRQAIGDRAERYMEVGTRAVRASVKACWWWACSTGSPRPWRTRRPVRRARCCGPRSPARWPRCRSWATRPWPRWRCSSRCRARPRRRCWR